MTPRPLFRLALCLLAVPVALGFLYCCFYL